MLLTLIIPPASRSVLPARSRGRGDRERDRLAPKKKGTKAAERPGLAWLGWVLGCLAAGWRAKLRGTLGSDVMTAQCHPPPRLSSPFKEGRPQISALSPPPITTNVTSSLSPDSVFEPTQLKRTRLSEQPACPAVFEISRRILGNRTVPPRLARQGPGTTRDPIPGVTENKRAETSWAIYRAGASVIL